jgi:hypothetical protein
MVSLLVTVSQCIVYFISFLIASVLFPSTVSDASLRDSSPGIC